MMVLSRSSHLALRFDRAFDPTN